MSREEAARRLKVDVSVVKQQERETTDLPLSILYQWQQLLNVPLSELVVDASDPLEVSRLPRPQMLAMAKTGLWILEKTKQTSIRRMAQTLLNQLVELMPDLREMISERLNHSRRRPTGQGPATPYLPPTIFIDRAD